MFCLISNPPEVIKGGQSNVLLYFCIFKPSGNEVRNNFIHFNSASCLLLIITFHHMFFFFSLVESKS